MRNLLRLFRINVVLMRHGLAELVLNTRFFRTTRVFLSLNPWHWFKHHNEPIGKRLRQALEELGPIFVKFGQILSTRRDLLPDDIALELVLLQDRVPPFDNQLAKRIIEKALGDRLEAFFADFSLQPLASASIAQVHAATLHNGEEVVIKVLRPGIDKIIKHDVALLYNLAKLAQRVWPDGKRLRPMDVVAEFEHSLLDELDLLREASNASQLRRNFSNSRKLYIPNVYWSLCRKNVMVMERIHGISVSRLEELRHHRINLEKLATAGVEIFFTQVFRDCFFHADMHAGNIFVNPRHPEQPQFIAVDFGIVGTLSQEDQHYLAYNLLAFFNRDYRQVAVLHVESGWVPPETRIEEFESAIRTVCEPVFERPLKEISFGQMLLRLFQTARRFNMVLQPQLLMLQKTLLNVEGLGRQLYPDLNLWATAKPFLERWMHNQVGLKAFYRSAKSQGPMWSAQLAQLPTQLFKLVEGELRAQHQREQQHQLLMTQLRQHNATQRATLLAFAAMALIGLGLGFLLLSPQYHSVIENKASLLGSLSAVLGLTLTAVLCWPKKSS